MQVTSKDQTAQLPASKAQDFDTALGAQNMPSLRVSSPKANVVRNDFLSNNRLQFLSGNGVSLQLLPSMKGDSFEISAHSYLPYDVPSTLDKHEVTAGKSYLSPKPSHGVSAHITLETSRGTEIRYGYDPRREYHIVRADQLDENDADFAQGKLTYVEPDNVADLVNTWEPEAFNKKA